MPFQLVHDSKQNPLSDGTGYNEFPHGWREITEAEFSQSQYFTYHPEYVEFRQMMDRANPSVPVVSATLYWLWNRTGYSIVRDYHAKQVKFFTFGCDHKWETQPDFVVMCVNCGFHHPRIDSSD